MAGAVFYLRSLPRRLGEVGRRVATSFLPWFVIVFSFLLVAAVSVALLVAWADWHLGSVFIHCYALHAGALVVALGCLAPRFGAWLPGAEEPGPERPGDAAAVALLPSVASALVVCQLCALSVSTGLQSGSTSQGKLYTFGFVGLLAATGLRVADDLLLGHRLVLQLACLGVLVVMAGLAPDAVFAWVVAALAFLAVQCASLGGRPTLPDGGVDEPAAEKSFADDEAGAGQDANAAQEAAGDEAATFWSALALMFGALSRAYKGGLRLAGVLLICAVAASRALEPGDGGKAFEARMISLGVPAALLTVHALLRLLGPSCFDDTRGGASWDASVTALLGLVVAAAPVRVMHGRSWQTGQLGLSSPSRIVDHEVVLWDVCLIVYPAILFGLSLAIAPPKTMELRTQAATTGFVVALCLMCLSLYAPVAFGFYGAVAFALAWRLPGAEAMLLASMFWVWRGVFSVHAELDDHLFMDWDVQNDDWVTAGLVTAVTCASVLAGMWRTSAEDDGKYTFLVRVLLYSSLLPTYLTCPFEWMPLLPMVAAVACLELRPRWELCLACGLALVMGRPFGQSFWGASLVASLVMAVAGARLTLFSSEDAARQAAVPAAWAVALACVPAGDGGFPPPWDPIVGALPLCAFSIALFGKPPPLLRPALHVLPGFWVVQLWLYDAGFENAWLASLVVGGLLMPLPALAECVPQLLGGAVKESAHLEEWLELVGLIWVILGAWLGLYWREGVGNVLSIAVPLAVGMTELILGLTQAKGARNRRVGGLICISISIFLGAGLTGGLLQGLLLLLGSLMTIGMAVLVATSRGDAEAEAEVDGGVREVLLEPGGSAAA